MKEELRTLKDIFEGIDEKWVRKDTLRAEAINHIKELTPKPSPPTPKCDKCGQFLHSQMLCGDIYFNKEDRNSAKIEWIKHFFNITEEDLK